MDHPSEEILERFAAGRATSEESRAVVAHLLKGCAPCATRLRSLMQPAAVPRDAYEPALDRFDQGLLDALESSISPVHSLRTLLLRLGPPREAKKE